MAGYFQAFWFYSVSLRLHCTTKQRSSSNYSESKQKSNSLQESSHEKIRTNRTNSSRFSTNTLSFISLHIWIQWNGKVGHEEEEALVTLIHTDYFPVISRVYWTHAKQETHWMNTAAGTDMTDMFENGWTCHENLAHNSLGMRSSFYRGRG
jgi:hypothetical protein